MDVTLPRQTTSERRQVSLHTVTDQTTWVKAAGQEACRGARRLWALVTEGEMEKAGKTEERAIVAMAMALEACRHTPAGMEKWVR